MLCTMHQYYMAYVLLLDAVHPRLNDVHQYSLILCIRHQYSCASGSIRAQCFAAINSWPNAVCLGHIEVRHSPMCLGL